MRLMISGGGTGGHVYPALAVVQVLKPETDVLWVGSETGIEKKLLHQAKIPYQGISAAGLRGKNPVAVLNGLLKLSKGYLQSRRIINNYKPDVLFVTGGYVCAPVTLAAYQVNIPIIIYLPDIQPGKAIKFLSRFATKIAVTASPAQAFFPEGLTVVTGYPARADLYTTAKKTARTRLNLHPTRPTILIFGGSQGARSINKAIANTQALTHLLTEAQIIHISGERDADWTQDFYQSLSTSQQTHYHLYAYLHQEMTDAFAAADLIVCRAGASILGEATAVGVPTILVPYPYSGAHQWPNAQYLADQGAAIIVPDADLKNLLVKTILGLLTNIEKRSEMAVAASRLARPEAANTIATQIQEVRRC